MTRGPDPPGLATPSRPRLLVGRRPGTGASVCPGGRKGERREEDEPSAARSCPGAASRRLLILPPAASSSSGPWPAATLAPASPYPHLVWL
ncbi:hypothetical protein NN561_018101 [Cricetulus griseus]